eukprot:1156916-Pelagomonas_calceolata.AAC.4
MQSITSDEYFPVKLCIVLSPSNKGSAAGALPLAPLFILQPMVLLGSVVCKQPFGPTAGISCYASARLQGHHRWCSWAQYPASSPHAALSSVACNLQCKQPRHTTHTPNDDYYPVDL